MENKNEKIKSAGPSPLLIFGLCGALLFGILLGTTILPWMTAKIASLRSDADSIVGNLVEDEDMLDENGSFHVMDYPLEDAAAYVDIPDLDELVIEPVEKPEITESDIDDNIRSWLIYYGHEIDRTEGVVNIGDRVRLNYSAVINGEVSEDYSAEGAVMKLGAATEPDGFSGAVDGCEVGETRVFNITFTDEWLDEDVIGLEVEFTVTVLAALETPELTDENIKEITGAYETVEAFRSYIRESLEELDGETYRDLVYSKVLEALLAGSTFKTASRELLSWYTSIQMMYYQMAADEAGMTVEAYLESVGLGDNTNRVANAIAGSGYEAIRRYAILTAVADKAGITVDPEDESDADLISHRQFELVTAMGDITEDWEEKLNARYGLANIYNDVRNQKTIDWLVEHVKQEHVENSVDNVDNKSDD